MMLVKHAVFCVAAVAVALSGATPAEGQGSVSFLGNAVLAADSLADATGATGLASTGLRAAGPSLTLAAGGFPFPLAANEPVSGPAAPMGTAPEAEPTSENETAPEFAGIAGPMRETESSSEPEAVSAPEPAGAPATATKRAGPIGAEMPPVEAVAANLDPPATGLVRADAAEGLRFRASQLREPRVAQARRHAEATVRSMFAERGLRYPTELLFRVFKQERVFELWALDPAQDRYVLVREYPVCAVSGHLGPKRQAGDRQVPEGFYDIDLLNPRSKYHLSMRVNYPNAVDLELSRADRPGGDIYVHGGCSTVGCVPVTDEAIEELYWLAVEARAQGQKTIPIHIFPTRMDGPAMRELAELSRGDYSTWRLWLSLKAGYDHFETHRRLPEIGHREGYYSVGG